MDAETSSACRTESKGPIPANHVTAIAGLCLAFFLPITRPSKFGAVASGERASRHQQVGRSTAVLAFALLYGEGTDTHESGSDRDSVRPFGRALWIHYLPPGDRKSVVEGKSVSVRGGP